MNSKASNYSPTLDNKALGVDMLVQDSLRLDISADFQSGGKVNAIEGTQDDYQHTTLFELELFSQFPSQGDFHLVSHFSDNL